MKKIPAVSIVIPMYNTEKYIGECLDSILAQTFQDFEVIVVDDCSTDNSRAVVESYLPKFNEGGGERLSLLSTKKNSGSASTPRNIGMKISRGEYIMFVDSDDAITPTALEELYSLAKRFDADVVNCTKFYQTPDEKNLFKDKKTLDKFYLQVRLDIKEPLLMTDNLSERVKIFGQRFPAATFRIVRRNLLEKNDIFFPKFPIGEDEVFTLNLLMSAKNFLIIPNAVYLWRENKDSVTRSKTSVEKMINKGMSSIIKGVRDFEKIMAKFEIFQQNPELKYVVFERFVSNKMQYYLLQLYAQIPAWQLDELVRRELDKVDDKTALTAFLFGRMNIFNINLNRQGALIRQMDAHIQKQNEVIRKLQQK